MNIQTLTTPEAAPLTRVRAVLTYGRFDGFQTGHALFLGRLSALGSDVIVGCATDAFCVQIGQPAHIPFAARREMLSRCRHVDRVIALSSWDQRLTDIVNHDVSVLALRDAAGPPATGLDAIVQVVHVPFEMRQTGAILHSLSA